MPRALRLGATIVGVSLLAIAAALVSLRPPPPLRSPPQGSALCDVTVVNPGTERRARQTIRVTGAVIESISEYASTAGCAPDALRHAGSYVLPGLIDMHVHHPPGRLPTDVKLFDLLHLAHGVTAVRDCGSIDGSILEIRSQIAAGEFAGPRIFACGPIIDGDPPFWPGSRIARSASEAKRIVEQIAASGVHCVKAYSRLTPDALAGLRAAATRHRLPLIGHVPISAPFETAHLDDVQHLTAVPGVQGPDEGSGLIRALLGGWDSIDDARIDFVVRTSLEQGIAHTPTIVVMERLLRLKDFAGRLEDSATHLLPRYYPELIWKPGAMASWSVPPLGPSTRARILERYRTVVRRLHEAGAAVHVGTDTLNPFVVPGASMHEELRNFVASGFTPEEAWEAATRRNGESLPEPDLGVIRPGAPADLLVFREDPTRDLTLLSTLQAVVADGRFYGKHDLDGAVARYGDYFHGWLYDRVTMLLFPLFDRSPRASSQEAPG
jgi:hypothetical protein